MKLNKEGRVELRANIEQQLKSVPEGKKIHLNKELLEQLLFETRVEELSHNFFPRELVGKKVSVKYLVWSGPFLSKVDLSEISFDNVFWDINYNEEDYFGKYSKNQYQEYCVKQIDLSNTNAKIDFSKAFGNEFYSTCGLELTIVGCNFSNIDLSNNLIDYNFCVDTCNFSNTGLKVNFKSESSIRFYSSILSGLDFSEYTVDERFFGEEWQQYIAFNCDLSNTGLKVKTTNIPSDICSKNKRLLNLVSLLNSNEISTEKKAEINFEMNKLYNLTDEYREELDCMEFLGEAMAKGYLVGCYVNDKLILSKEQRQESAQERKEEYEKFKQELFDSVNSSMEEQIRKMKR